MKSTVLDQVNKDPSQSSAINNPGTSPTNSSKTNENQEHIESKEESENLEAKDSLKKVNESIKSGKFEDFYITINELTLSFNTEGLCFILGGHLDKSEAHGNFRAPIRVISKSIEESLNRDGKISSDQLYILANVVTVTKQIVQKYRQESNLEFQAEELKNNLKERIFNRSASKDALDLVSHFVGCIFDENVANDKKSIIENSNNYINKLALKEARSEDGTVKYPEVRLNSFVSFSVQEVVPVVSSHTAKFDGPSSSHAANVTRCGWLSCIR